MIDKIEPHIDGALREKAEKFFIMKFALVLVLLIVAAYLCAMLSFPYCILPQLVIGGLYYHMKELQHETLHGVMSRRWLNQFFGTILGLPMLVSYSEYKYYHMLHHRYIGTDKNTEYFVYDSTQAVILSVNFLYSLFMIRHYKNVLMKILRGITLNYIPIKINPVRNKVRNEYLVICSVIFFMILLSILGYSVIVLKLWLIPIILFCIPINFLMELPEHFGCEHDSIEVLKNTRTIKSNSFMTWFVNGNNYHVEHHLIPSYPIYALCDLHESIKTRITYYNASYQEFFKKTFRLCGS